MAEAKTKPTNQSVQAFLDAVPHPGRREDGWRILELMAQATGLEPVMWGPTMIGFGQVHYRYASGHEGDTFHMGFSPRKANLVLYLAPGPLRLKPVLDRLGPHKVGKGCIYLNRLKDVDPLVLEELIRLSV